MHQAPHRAAQGTLRAVPHEQLHPLLMEEVDLSPSQHSQVTLGHSQVTLGSVLLSGPLREGLVPFPGRNVRAEGWGHSLHVLLAQSKASCPRCHPS